VSRSTEHRRLAALGVAALAATLVISQVLWIPLIAGTGDTDSVTERDWIAFHRTAERLAAGATEDIYLGTLEPDGRPEFQDGLYFLYPPFTIWLTRPLAGLSPARAYALCAAAAAAGIMAAFLWLLLLGGPTRRERVLALVSLAASYPWNAAIFLGHLGALLVASPVAALAALSRGRPALAGCSLGLLLAKPNWGLPVLALIVAGRQWRMAGGFVACGAVLVFASLPLGPELWVDWWRTVGAYGAWVSESVPLHKQSTLLAVARAVTGRAGTEPLVLALWVPAAAFLCGWLVRLWVVVPARASEALPRLMGTTLLVILVANPYAYVYDLLLLLPAALTLWTGDARYGHRRGRTWARGASLVAYWGIYVQLLQAAGEGVAFMGLPLALWAVVELLELERSAGGRSRPAHDPVAGSAAPA